MAHTTYSKRADAYNTFKYLISQGNIRHSSVWIPPCRIREDIRYDWLSSATALVTANNVF